MKHFSEQGFLHDLFHFDWGKIELIADVDVAWKCFYDGFSYFINKHAPLRRYRVKGRNNGWFTPDLSELLHQRNLAWAKDRKTDNNSDWLAFRQLRNVCTMKIRSAKANYFLSQTTQNLNNPSKFWKTIKSISDNSKSFELPPCIFKDSEKISDKAKMLSCFNEHFIASGFLFESLNSTNFNANFNATFNYFTDGQNQPGLLLVFIPF